MVHLSCNPYPVGEGNRGGDTQFNQSLKTRDLIDSLKQEDERGVDSGSYVFEMNAQYTAQSTGHEQGHTHTHTD